MKQPAKRSVGAKPKVLIIFPRYNPDDASHYPYWYKLFNQAGDELNIALLFESANAAIHTSTFPNLNVIKSQHWQQKPFNLLERSWHIIKAAQQGYKKVYIHYSDWSVIICWLLKPFLGLQIYYWNCERYDTKPKNIPMNLAIKLCDVLVTGHEMIAFAYKEVYRMPQKDIQIVPSWVEEEQVGSNEGEKIIRTSQSSPLNILFLHHLSPRKGSRELPQIIKQTLIRLPHAFFQIVGDGPDRRWLETQLAQEVVRNQVKFFGKLSLSQSRKMIRQADVFIMPSRAEGFPRVILEAMIQKLPFVSTDVGCVKEIVSQNQLSYLVSPGDSKSFAKKLIFLINSLADQDNLSYDNYEKAKQYSLSQSSKEFKELFIP